MPSNAKPNHRTLAEWSLTLPSLLWLLLFFLIPTSLVLVLSFKPADMQGGVGQGWTLAHFQALQEPQYLIIFWRTLWLCLATTAICLALAIPTACAIARAKTPWRHLLLILVIVPFWTNFLIRIFAWKSLLHPLGPISRFLQYIGLQDEGGLLLYNSAAVLLVMVYTQLPFAILPLYAAAERFDPHLLHAARDLGASRAQAFFHIFLPNISRGIVAAALMVFVCTLGIYIVPDIVGGTDSEMLGNKIAQRVNKDRNLPLASALSALLLFGVTFMLLFGWLWQRRKTLHFTP